MLSPKLQRPIRVNDMQLIMLSERAHRDHSIAGYLQKKTAGNGQWRQRYFVLYQVINAASLLSARPSAVSLHFIFTPTSYPQLPNTTLLSISL